MERTSIFVVFVSAILAALLGVRYQCFMHIKHPKILFVAVLAVVVAPPLLIVIIGPALKNIF